MVIWILLPVVLFLEGCLKPRKILDPEPTDANRSDEGEEVSGSDMGVERDSTASNDVDVYIAPDASMRDVSNSVDAEDAPADREVGEDRHDATADAGVPQPPLLLNPSRGAVLQPKPVFLSWQDRIPSGRDIFDHEVCMTTGPVEEIEANCSRVEGIFSVIPSPIAGATYLWKAKTCFDEAGADCAEFSDVGNFSVGDGSLLPFAEWNFNGNLNDEGPNALHGEAPISPGFAGPTFVQNGDRCDGETVSGLLAGDRAACFDDSDGTYDYVELGQRIASLGFGSEEDYSVEARFRRDRNEREVDLFKMNHGVTPSPEIPVFSIKITTGSGLPEFRNRIFTELTGIQLYSEELAPSSFTHSVITYEGEIGESALRIYLGGILQSEDVGDYDFSAADFNFATFHAYSGCPETCGASENILIDSVAIYRRSLSPQEIINNACVREVLVGEIGTTLPSACLNSLE